MKRKHWNIKEIDSRIYDLGRTYGLPPLVVQVLLNRSVSPDQFTDFLEPTRQSLYDPYLLPDLSKAVSRIHQAVAAQEKVLVFGDYDVDGITSLAIFYEFAKQHKELFTFYVPHRSQEGYGLNSDVIRQAHQQGITLIIAFDCGTNADEEINVARSLGMDTIVIDHHLPRQDFLAPLAFVNPKRHDSVYPFSELSSGALSFKLLQALDPRKAWESLDLVALSLVCDVVPLVGENRALLREGLAAIRRTSRLAIKTLCNVARIKQENIDTYHIGFILGPRINAAGRVAHAQDSLDIFLNDDAGQVRTIVNTLHQYNIERKAIETKILRQAEQCVSDTAGQDYAIVVAGDGWHPGVLGIVASRLVEKYYRPTFVISFDEQMGKGSARSIHSVHLMEMLHQCSDHLPDYGGHRKAAGLVVQRKDLDSFREKINEVIKNHVQPQDLVPIIEVEALIGFEDITESLVYAVAKLRPFGESNPTPLFASYQVCKHSPVQKVRFGYSVWLTQQGRTFEGVFYDKDMLDILNFGDTFDIAYSVEYNTYHYAIQLKIKQIRIHKGRGE